MTARALIAKLVAHEGQRDAVLALIERVKDEVGNQPGTLAFNAHPEGDDVLWIYELYADDDAWAAHQAGPAFKAIQPELAPFFAAPPEVRVLPTVLQHGRAHP